MPAMAGADGMTGFGASGIAGDVKLGTAGRAGIVALGGEPALILGAALLKLGSAGRSITSMLTAGGSGMFAVNVVVAGRDGRPDRISDSAFSVLAANGRSKGSGASTVNSWVDRFFTVSINDCA